MWELDEYVVANLNLPDAVFAAWADRPALSGLLRQNPYLPEPIWIQLYEKGIDSHAASTMIDSALSEAQIDHVIAVEKRASLLVQLLGGHEAARTPDRLVAIAAKCGSQKLAETLLDAGLDEAHWHLIEAKFDPATKLAHACFNDDLDDAALVEMLSTIDTWWGKSRRYQVRKLALDYVLNTRPQLVAQLAVTPVPAGLTSALAQSRHLLDEDQQWAVVHATATNREPARHCDKFTAFALINNPVCHATVVREFERHDDYEVVDAALRITDNGNRPIETPFEEVTDPMQLMRLIRRCMPNQYKPVGRPWDLLALANNPAVTGETADKIASTLATDGVSATLGDDITEQALTALRERTGITVAFNHAGVKPAGSLGAGGLAPGHARHTERFTLDNSDGAFTESALASFPERPTRSAVLHSTVIVSVYLHLELGDDPELYETFRQIAKTHQGPLTEAVTTTKLIAA